jgi:hypothetical protein
MRRSMWMIAAGIVATVAALTWLGPEFGGHHFTGLASTGVSGAEGTAGRAEPVPTDADLAPATIREIETITGAVDGHELIGRRVDLHLKATGVTSRGAFWVGPRDNHVFVAPSRDTRTKRRALREGAAVTIAGTIEAVPDAEARERLSWGLTGPELVQLTDQRVYIRPDRITPE